MSASVGRLFGAQCTMSPFGSATRRRRRNKKPTRGRCSVAVLGEAGRVPDRIVRRKPHEPAVQEIVVQLLHQLAFRPNAIEHLQQQSAQQLLRRDRGTSFAGVKLPEATVQLTQNVSDEITDLPQRMVRRHPCLRRDVRKQPALIRKNAPHESPRRFMIYN